MQISKSSNEVLVFIKDKDKVLLINKKRGLGAGKVNVPGGKVHVNETPEEAAVREVEEEVGLKIKKIEKKGMILFINNNTESIITHIFTAQDYEGEPKESDEAEPFWKDISDLPYEKMWDADKYWVPYVLKGFKVFGEVRFENWKHQNHEINVVNDALNKLLKYAVNNEEFCPYFSETSWESYLLALKEEIEEVANARTKDELVEELGDVLHDLLSVLWKLHREKVVSIEDVVNSLMQKMKERKPQVFERKKTSFKEAVENWLKAKKMQDERKSKSLYEALRKETKKWLLKIKPLKFEALTKEGEEMVKNIKAYEKDTEYFLKEGKLIEAFEAVVWAWAWLEIGERYGFIKRREI
ncbi:MAG: DUF357 domain-containing protein [Candidatus Nanohaloarchaeota archaeon]|nr:DUF357 domain-containing protein [Candidatus Nanohaloarchaeota archaeon]